ncbi:MAG TPA: helix-turn-helix domain-containing protein [Bordetella sp.]
MTNNGMREGEAAWDLDAPPSAGADDGPAGPPAHAAAFGQKLRAVRKAKHMTLQELARRAEISPGLLSQVERGVSSPLLKTLLKLRNALDLPSSFFFEEDPPLPQAEADPSYLCRAGDRPRLDMGDMAPHKELLHHNDSRVFEMMIIHIPPRTKVGPAAMQYPSEKGGLVLEGRVDLNVDGRSSLLSSGDSFLFDGSAPHFLYNPTDSMARTIWVVAKLPNDSPF